MNDLNNTMVVSDVSELPADCLRQLANKALREVEDIGFQLDGLKRAMLEVSRTSGHGHVHCDPSWAGVRRVHDEWFARQKTAVERYQKYCGLIAAKQG